MQHGGDACPPSLSLPQQLYSLQILPQKKKDQLCQSISSATHNLILKAASVCCEEEACSKTPSCKASPLQSSVIFDLTSIIFSKTAAAPPLSSGPLSEAINTDFSVQGKSSVPHNIADPFH